MTKDEFAHAINEFEAASEQDGYTLDIHCKSGQSFLNAATWATNGSGLLKLTTQAGSMAFVAISEIEALDLAA